MKTVAAVLAVTGVTMASGIEGFEDHSFVLKRNATKFKFDWSNFRPINGVLQKPRMPPMIEADEFDDNNFAVEDLGDAELFSLFKKKKKPQPQPQPKPAEDTIDFGEPIKVDLNSDEFFADLDDNNFAVEDLGDDNFGLLSIFKKKKKPQQPQQPSQPVEIPSNEFFADELGDGELFFNIFKIFQKKKQPKGQEQQQFQPKEVSNTKYVAEFDDNNFAVEDLGDAEFFSLFGKKKKPQPPKPQPKPAEDTIDFGEPIKVDLNSDEFFADFDDNNFAVEDLGDDNFGFLSIFKKKKKPQQPQQPSQPVEIPSNEFFADELADENFAVEFDDDNYMTYLPPGRFPNEKISHPYGRDTRGVSLEELRKLMRESHAKQY